MPNGSQENLDSDTGSIAARLVEEPRRVSELAQAMLDQDPVVRMRAVDALEKAARASIEVRRLAKAIVLERLEVGESNEVRWQLASLAGMVPLSRAERSRAFRVLKKWARPEEESRLVQVNAMAGMVELASSEPHYRNEVRSIIERNVGSASAAVSARCKKLLKRLQH